MNDALTLEKAGNPTALICTTAFAAPARAIASARGAPGYPFVVIAHPVSTLDAAGVKTRAQEASPQVLKLLVADD